MNRRVLCAFLATLMAWQPVAIATAATAADFAAAATVAADHCAGQHAADRASPGSESPCCPDGDMTIAGCLSACSGPAIVTSGFGASAVPAESSTPGFTEFLIDSVTSLPLTPPPIA